MLKVIKRQRHSSSTSAYDLEYVSSLSVIEDNEDEDEVDNEDDNVNERTEAADKPIEFVASPKNDPASPTSVSKPLLVPSIVIHESTPSPLPSTVESGTEAVGLGLDLDDPTDNEAANMRKIGGGSTVGGLLAAPNSTAPPMISNLTTAASGGGGPIGPVSKATISVSDVDGRAFDILLR